MARIVGYVNILSVLYQEREQRKGALPHSHTGHFPVDTCTILKEILSDMQLLLVYGHDESFCQIVRSWMKTGVFDKRHDGV